MVVMISVVVVATISGSGMISTVEVGVITGSVEVATGSGSGVGSVQEQPSQMPGVPKSATPSSRRSRVSAVRQEPSCARIMVALVGVLEPTVSS